MLIVLLVPFAASMKDTLVCTSIVSPTKISCCSKGLRPPDRPRRPPPVKPLNKSSKLNSAPKPPAPNPPAPLNGFPAPPKGSPLPGPPGPDPGPAPWSKAAAPNWSHAAFFCGSVRSSYEDCASENLSFAVGSYSYLGGIFLQVHNTPSLSQRQMHSFLLQELCTGLSLLADLRLRGRSFYVKCSRESRLISWYWAAVTYLLMEGILSESAIVLRSHL